MEYIPLVVSALTILVLSHLNLKPLRKKCDCKLLGCECPPDCLWITLVGFLVGLLSMFVIKSKMLKGLFD